jgi:hypothetical protein
MTADPRVVQDAAKNQESDQVEPMHDGAKAEADDFSGGPREVDSERGPSDTDKGDPANPGGTTGEHSGQAPHAKPIEKSK